MSDLLPVNHKFIYEQQPCVVEHEQAHALRSMNKKTSSLCTNFVLFDLAEKLNCFTSASHTVDDLLEKIKIALGCSA